MISESFIQEQYRKFSKAEGSQFIASEYALKKILEYLQNYKPKTILEIGIGIGTITDSVLKAFHNNYRPVLFGTENNKFCLSKLPENLGEQYNSLNIFPSIKNLPSDSRFDLIIIDGKESNLNLIKDFANDHCVVIVEGDRKDQTEIFRSLFPKSRIAHSITSKKNSSYSNRLKEHYQGGIKFIFINPNFIQNLEWVKLKLESKFHFIIRKYRG